MSQYAISAAIKSSVTLEDEAVYRKLDELFFRRNGLAVAVRGLRGCYAGTFLFVLQTIASATLRWKKPYELLRVNDFVQGRPDSGCYSPGVSDRTVYRALKALCREGLLFKVTANDGRDVHYALNFELLMERLGNAIDSFPGRSLISKETERLFTELKNSPDLAALVQAIKRFAGTAIRDIKEFLQSLKAVGGKTVATLETAVRAAKTIARDYTEKRVAAKADRPLVRGHSVDPAAGLALWHREVRDTEEHSGYVPAMTGKLVGQMKHWLRELVEQDLTEEQIRGKIRSYVRKWAYVPDRKRELTCVSAAGKPYKLRMSYTPNFDVFFAHRAAISPLLEETCEPGKFADGTARGYYDYR